MSAKCMSLAVFVAAVPFGLAGTIPSAGNAAAAAAMAGLRLAQTQIGTVLLVSNLQEEVRPFTVSHCATLFKQFYSPC